MKSSTVILATVLAFCAGILSIVVTVALCYFFWPKKFREFQDLTFSGSRKDSVVELKRHNVEDRLSQGSVSIVTPLITPVTVQPSTKTSVDNISIQPLLPEVEVFCDRVTGNVSCGFDYNRNTSSLKITVILSQDGEKVLGSVLYLRCCLLPFKKNVIDRKIKHSPLTRRWIEMFIFDKIVYDKLPGSIFYFQLFTLQNWKLKVIGELKVSVYEAILNEQPVTFKSFQVPQPTNLGEILLSLIYDDKNNDLIVTIIKIRSCEPIEPYSESCVVLTLSNSDCCLEKYQSKFLPMHPNPIFNETCRFRLGKNCIKDVCLVSTLVTFANINVRIGDVTLSALAGGVATKQWTDIERKPRFPILQWHKIW
ncbi:synaptotagmin-7-like [Centruroides sculpturatus]|uniref:synaptotagmin-7-like n=1 Tax=Centruroides sculpturatus TaxID=218467 RepID=UPI000C6DE0EA|nr:synaptotagmin-7-like [Centruroides sculpturatus]